MVLMLYVVGEKFRNWIKTCLSENWDLVKISDSINKSIGSLVKATVKKQGKYKSVRATIVMRNQHIHTLEHNQDLNDLQVRWYPSNWTLRERKARDQFQAVLENISNELTTKILQKDRSLLQRYKLKCLRS